MQLRLELQQVLVTGFMIIFFCFIMNRTFFFSQGAAESTSSYILYPIIKIEKFFLDPIARYFSRQSDMATLEKNVEQLQQVNETLQAKIIALESILDFKNGSAQLYEYAQRYTFDEQKLVQVLMRSLDDVGHIFWVDAGSRHGVTLNMIAVYKNSIVGRVIHVDPSMSKIALITDKRSKIAVCTQTTKAVGILQGNNSDTPTLEFVPHYETLKIDDLVLSTGQGLVYPEGFAVGKIQDFFIDDVAYHIQVAPLLDFKTVQYLYLVAI